MDYPVALAIPNSSDVLVLTDYMDAQPGVGNLARTREDGTEAWRASPDPLSQDTWTVVRVEGLICRASTWSGCDVLLDLDTGHERERHFAK